MIEVVLNDRLGKKIRVKCKCVRLAKIVVVVVANAFGPERQLD